MDGDDELTQGTEAGGGDDGGDFEFEIDLESTEYATGPSTEGLGDRREAAPQRGARQPEVVERDEPLTRLERRYDALEAENRRLLAEVAPYISEMRTRYQSQQQAPPFTPEQLDDPASSTRPSDLLRWVDWRTQQQAREIYAQAQAVARREMSTERIRGLFSSSAMGEGFDYDTMTGKYLAPLYRENPHVQQLVHAAAPNDPALAEMLFAAVCYGVEQVRNDPVKGLRNFIDSLGSFQAGRKDVTKRITAAANEAAGKIQRRGRANPQASPRKLDARGIWDSSDAAFDRLVNATGGY